MNKLINYKQHDLLGGFINHPVEVDEMAYEYLTLAGYLPEPSETPPNGLLSMKNHYSEVFLPILRKYPPEEEL
jgi:hypothetical protein